MGTLKVFYRECVVFDVCEESHEAENPSTAVRSAFLVTVINISHKKTAGVKREKKKQQNIVGYLCFTAAVFNL